MTVRVGFLGGGLIATYHGNMLRGSGADVEIAAVHDPDPTKAAAFARSNGAEVVASEEDLLSSVEAVYVCTWTAEHPRLVTEAAGRGLSVFCEKPLATDLRSAETMVEAVERAGVTNQVGLVLRDSPSFALLRTLIQRPESGRVMSVVFRDDQYIPIQGMYGSTWRGEVGKAGSGTLLEHSIHDLDLLEWMLGPANSVSGRSAAFHGIEGIEDVVWATLGFESGAQAGLTSVWHDVLRRPSQRYVEVHCERAWYALEGDVFGPVRWMTDDDEGVVEGDALMAVVAEHGISVRNPDRAFVEAIARGEPARPSLVDALRAHVLVDATYRSCEAGGQPVRIPAPAGQGD